MRERFSWAGLLLLAALSSGCQSNGGVMGWFRKDTVAGVVTPAERITELRRQANSAGSLSFAEQEKLATKIAEQLPTETDAVIRVAMLRVLEKTDVPPANAALKQALQDGDKDVRIVACEAWGKRETQESMQILGGVLASDTSIDVQLAAARALGECGDKTAVPLFLPALDSRDPALQHRATESLAAISGASYGDNVAAWREFAQGNKPQVPEQSIAERLRELF